MGRSMNRMLKYEHSIIQRAYRQIEKYEAQQMRAYEMMIAQDSEKAKALYGSEHVDTKNDRRLRKYVTIKPRARQVSTNTGYTP